jgi:hypothetical protein
MQSVDGFACYDYSKDPLTPRLVMTVVLGAYLGVLLTVHTRLENEGLHMYVVNNRTTFLSNAHTCKLHSKQPPAAGCSSTTADLQQAQLVSLAGQ